MSSNQHSQDQLLQDPPAVPTLSTEERMNMFEQSLMVMNTNMNRLLTLFEAQATLVASALLPSAQAPPPAQVQEPPPAPIQMPPPAPAHASSSAPMAPGSQPSV